MLEFPQFSCRFVTLCTIFAAGNPPPKPWERAGGSSGPAPFKPPSMGNTSDVVEASGTANPGEIVPANNGSATANTSSITRPMPTRPWEQGSRGAAMEVIYLLLMRCLLRKDNGLMV